MDLAMGAMKSLLAKLVELGKEEYKLQTGVMKDVKFVEREMRSMGATLREVAKVPRDQLNEQVKAWADDLKELSYEMEDVVDSFLVRVEGAEPVAKPDGFRALMQKMVSLFKKSKERHEIADAIKDIKERVQNVAARRDRYKLDGAGANPAAVTTVDPRILDLFKDKAQFVGIEKPRDELIKRLTDGDNGVSNSKQQLKILSIFGFGGLGKTTLAKVVYDTLRPQFESGAFVSVGRNPELTKVFKEIFLEVDRKEYAKLQVHLSTLEETQLIKQLHRVIENKRCLIVIDDIWDIKSWDIIKCAWVDNNCGSIIITTTRILKVAKQTDCVYRHEPLSDDNSRELFHKRLSIGKGKHSYDPSVEISEKILQKCGGVPLAIITLASILDIKPKEDWREVCDSIGFGNGTNEDIENTRNILLYSYYDLPYYLRTCLLHLSIYPEDDEIQKNTLIWKWIAEGFVREEPGMSLFEVGETYFNELINRSMIQPVEIPYKSIITGCRLHDLVLDMILVLLKEENFVTILDSNKQCTSSQSNIRWLAIQKRVADEQQDANLANTPMRQVRSFNATECHLDMMPSLSSFQVLRVLALERCTFVKDRSFHLEHLGKLLQLRCLSLSCTPITELPEEIGNLRFLQTLDLTETMIEQLPQSIGLLRQLRCLLTGDVLTNSMDRLFDITSEIEIVGPCLDWIGNLTSLEELSLDHVSSDFVKELGKLTELRRFRTDFRNPDHRKPYIGLWKDLMESLGNLQKLQVIQVDSRSNEWCVPLEWTNCEGNVLPRHLRHLTIEGAWFPRLPMFMDSSRLPHLAHLHLKVKTVEAQDVEILGRFPDLITLHLRTPEDVVFPDVVGGGAFPKLRYLRTRVKLRFLQGAMPSLEYVRYSIQLEVAILPTDVFDSLGNLPCLEKVIVKITRGRPMDKEKASALLKQAVKIHPNTPTLQVSHRSVIQNSWVLL